MLFIKLAYDKSMKTVEQLIKEYLPRVEVMQLATAHNGQPWACTVHFVSDDHLNLYWLSTPERRHSREISQNPHIAAAMAVQSERHVPAIGVQVEGDAAVIEDATELKRVMDLYATKHNSDPQWVDDVVAGVNLHKLYCLRPRLYVLFDKQTFPQDPLQEWQVK